MFVESLIFLHFDIKKIFFRLYEERNSQVELRLAEVKLGTALEYTQPLEELHQNLKNRLEVAGSLFICDYFIYLLAM